jgi:hypothetical protein
MSDSPIPPFLRAVDALDLEAAMSLFDPAAVLAMPFGEEAVGEQQLRGVLDNFLAELRGTQHDLTSEWNPEPGVWIAEFSATYELKDFSRRGPYKRAVFVRTRADKIEHMTFYGAHEVPLSDEGRPYTNVRGPHGWLPTL